MSVAAHESTWAGKLLALAAKDVRVELRGRDTLPPMLAFTGAVVLLLAFTVPAGRDVAAPVDLPFGTVAVANVLAGFVWITALFAGLIGFARTFEVEREDGALDAVLLAPLDRSAIFFSKALANLASIVLVQIVLFPLFAIFFGLGLSPAAWLGVIAVVVMADLGFVLVGTLFAAVAAQTRSRELILPILALPALVPVFIAAVELTADLFSGVPVTTVTARGWFGVLAFFDVVLGIIGALTFEFVVEP